MPVVDGDGFVGEERLAVAGPDQRPVVGVLRLDQLVEVLAGREDLARGLRAVELGLVAADRLHLGGKRRADVGHERRLHRILAVSERVDDLERPVRFAGGVVFREAREVAGVARQLGREPMVGVASDGEGQDDGPGPEPADEGDDASPVLVGVVQVRIGQSRVGPRVHAQGARGGGRFVGAFFGRPPATRLARNEVQYPDRVSLADGEREGPAARQLGVVGMGGDGEEVELHIGLRAGVIGACRARAA